MSGVAPIQVLLVHNPREALDVLAERLTREGYVVRTLGSAQEALEAVGRGDIHLIATQMRLPGVSGIELKRQVQSRFPTLPVIVLESFRSIRSSEELMRYGPADFILDANELASIAERLTGGRVRLEDRLYANPEIQNFLCNLILTFTEMLGRAVPAFGPNQAEKRVVSLEVARRMGLPDATARDIGLAALLYDIGKIRISEFVLAKEDALSDAEQTDVHNHCHWSLQLMEKMGLPDRIQQVVLHHHERFDGQGYPSRLMGRAIPIGSRILSVVDSFFAMIAPRPYREPRTEDEAFVELNRGAGTQFDPEVVEHFVRVIEERYRGPGEEFRKEIAVVDDDPGALELLRFNFEREGYAVRCFRSAKDALEKLPQRPPSLILTDVVMPDMSGFEFLERLKSRSGMRSVPFVFASGSKMDEHDKVKGLDLGADDYLEKPFHVHELNSKVRALLRRARREDGSRPRSGGIAGNVRDLPLPDIIQLLYHGRKTCLIDVRQEGDDRAEVYLEGGNVTHAAIASHPPVTGVPAFVRILGWKEAEFSIRHGLRTDLHTIQVETSQLLLQGLVDIDTINHAATNVGD